MNVANLRTAGRWLALCCLPLLAGSCGKHPAIADMRCEYLASPISVDTPSPPFTWTYEDADAFVQAGYRLCVATAPEKLDLPDIWNSGEIAGSRPFAAMPDGGLLVSRTPYYWRVEAWDAGGRRIVSPVAEFETALMETSEWQARWITDAHDKDFVPAPMLRRAFAVRSGVERARLYVSAAAYAKMSLNGEPVSGNLLDPGYTHYDKRNLYAVHDVTDRLREGENVLSAVLGNGFYNAIQPVATWSFEVARWRGRARMICELHIDYADGTHEVVCSDGSWRTTADGPYLSNNIYSGDVYDARREIPGWDRPGFDDSAWAQAVEVAAPSPLLKAQSMPAVRATCETEPVGVRSFGDTIWVFDFGVNLTGLCRLEIEGERGTQITMTHGEFVQPSGRIEMRNLDIYYKPLPGYDFQTDTYILKGEGRETWTPDFTYHGFQYVELRSSAPVKLDKTSLTARFMHTDVSSVGKFSCSNGLFNRIWEMTRRTYLNNLTSIPTDCPQREKNGWTADGYLAMDLALLNYDGMAFYEKWLDDFIDNQNEAGRLAGIIPTAGWGYDDWIGPVWDASAFIIPYTLYNYYGDLRPVEKMWPVCERYLEYLATREEADGVLRQISRWQKKCWKEMGTRFVFASDEFYCLAGRSLPAESCYEDFPQIENGVGLFATLRAEFEDALQGRSESPEKKRFTIACGVSVAPLLSDMIFAHKWQNLELSIVPVRSGFFGGAVTVTGRIAGCDLVRDLAGRDVGTLLIVESMLRAEGDKFLDDMTLEELRGQLGAPVCVLENTGEALAEALLNGVGGETWHK